MEEKKLNLGCGEDRKEGFVNLDWNKLVEPDVVHDLNKAPYPFSDNEFALVNASHVLEHLEKPFAIMAELHRLLKPGGKLIIKVPHFSRGFTHAEHEHGFDVTFPLYFDKKYAKNDFSGYYGVDFELVKIKLTWMKFFNALSSMGYNKIIIQALKILNNIINILASLSPNFCSRVWCYWVGGFEEIEFEFICRK